MQSLLKETDNAFPSHALHSTCHSIIDKKGDRKIDWWLVREIIEEKPRTRHETTLSKWIHDKQKPDMNMAKPLRCLLAFNLSQSKIELSSIQCKLN